MGAKPLLGQTAHQSTLPIEVAWSSSSEWCTYQEQPSHRSNSTKLASRSSEWCTWRTHGWCCPGTCHWTTRPTPPSLPIRSCHRSLSVQLDFSPSYGVGGDGGLHPVHPVQLVFSGPRVPSSQCWCWWWWWSSPWPPPSAHSAFTSMPDMQRWDPFVWMKDFVN